MSEYTAANPETIAARRAVWDYLSLGPELAFGEIEGAALDEWISTCEGVALRPKDTTNVAWMHIERSWSRVAEAGGLGQNRVGDDIITAVKTDLAAASNLFDGAIMSAKSDPVTRTHGVVARFSIPMFDHILTGSEHSSTHRRMRHYHEAQFATLLTYYANLKRQNLSPHLIPVIDSSLGLFLLTEHFLNTDYVPLPAAYRHSHGGGSPYHQWHAALHDRDNGTTHKVRIAPHGPPDVIVLPPELLDHAGYPTRDGRGTLQAAVMTHLWHDQRGSLQQPGSEAITVLAHMDRVSRQVEDSLTEQLHRIQGHTNQEQIMPDNPEAWYDALPPHIDPCHKSHGGALEAAIAQAEVRLAGEELGPAGMYNLGWMYMESGMSFVARDTEGTALLGASFERAEDVFNKARLALPPHTSRYYEAAIGEIAAPMYRALIVGEDVSERIDIYCGQLAIIAAQVLEDYKAMPDKTAAEAEALGRILQHITIFLAASHGADRSHVALPSSPRQRGGVGTPRGWDFTMWAFESEDDYLPGAFYGRLEEQEDPRTIDEGIITLALKSLGQWTPAHDFRTLRTILTTVDAAAPRPKNFKPEHKLVAKVNRHLSAIIDASDD